MHVTTSFIITACRSIVVLFFYLRADKNSDCNDVIQNARRRQVASCFVFFCAEHSISRYTAWQHMEIWHVRVYCCISNLFTKRIDCLQADRSSTKWSIFLELIDIPYLVLTLYSNDVAVAYWSLLRCTGFPSGCDAKSGLPPTRRYNPRSVVAFDSYCHVWALVTVTDSATWWLVLYINCT